MITKAYGENRYIITCDFTGCLVSVIAGNLKSRKLTREYPETTVKHHSRVRGWIFIEDGRHYCPKHLPPYDAGYERARGY